MQPTLCTRCKKRVAVVFISKIEKGEAVNEGLCLRCAKDLGLPQVNDMMRRMGITDEDLDAISDEMMHAFGGAESMEGMIPRDDEEDESEDGKTATFPFLNRLFNSAASSGEPAPESPRSHETKERKSDKPPKRKYLDSYCINLTERARSGKLDQLVGREQEIERVVQILNRRQKNNPCLIGEPGVGKTAIAEGLAQRIANREVPEGSMNAANILKPALSRGEIQVIGATTFTEYRKHIEKDTALERRFQPVTVNEPNLEDTMKILRGIAHYYESFHGVKIPEGILRQAVVLSERYITDRFLPDKAIDLIDEACSDMNLKDAGINRRQEISRELADYGKERELLEAVEEPNFERLAEIKSRELQLQTELDGLSAQGEPQLTMDNLARVIELWTKIPASKIREEEFKRLSELDQRLRTKIVGQDEAIDAVSAAIRRNRVGISPKHKPVSFIFVGSTGVGKTELVKQLAEDLFNAPESLIRLDMSEFMEKHSVSRIIGSPPGYVGYDEAGQLTEKIRRKPYSVVLFDEIEKAHPDVLNVLLQILDDGQITDAHGRKVNFENTVIVMTSNAGSDRKEGSVGFNKSVNEQGKDRAMKALQQFLRPEFLNRVDEIVYFNKLTEENFLPIARLMLDELRDSLKEKGLTFTYDVELVKWLVKKSYSAAYGARNLRRTIQKEVEDVLAVEIINSFDHPVTHLSVTAEEDKVSVRAL